ncbi:WD40 repeat-like protein [Thecaphora frezii]
MSATAHSLFAANPTTARGQSTKLSVDPKGEKLIYAQNRTVIIRSLVDPSQPAVTYSQHPHPVTVARFSPSGYYCASADQSGTVRVWDLVGAEQILKGEYKVIAGRINDLHWDGESKRIIAVGDGRERFGHAFSFDTGSSVGEITGHSRPINAVAIRKDRPFRAVTVGDDNNVVFYHGTPYKFQKTLSTHTRFVQDVSYSPSGDHFVTVGSDGKVLLYDGKTGDVISELSAKVSPSEGHVGTIYAVDFAADSRRFVTAGADGFVKVWDVAAVKVVESYDLNGRAAAAGRPKAEDQQVGVVWASNDKIVSLSLLGEINVIQGGQISLLYGACKSIGPGALEVDADGKALVAGCYDGRVLRWSLDGSCQPIAGSGHSNAVLSISSDGSKLVSVGIDDTARRISGDRFETAAIPTSGQPKGAASSGKGTTVVAVPGGIDIIPAGATSKSHQAFAYEPSAVAISADERLIAVGSENSKVYLYSFDGVAVKEAGTLESNRSVVTALAFDPAAGLLAVGESTGKIVLYDVASLSLKSSQWVFHSARINSIRFSPDGSHAVSGSLDTHVYVWSVKKPMKNIAIKNAHANGVNAVVWIDDATVASAGADGCIRTFAVKRHEGA